MALPAVLVTASDLNSVLYIVPLLIIFTANVGMTAPDDQRGPAAVARQVTWAMLAVVGVSAAIFGTWMVATPHRLPLGLAMLVAGAISLLSLWEPFRVALARVLPIDPSSVLHATAIVFTVALAALEVGSQLSSDVIAQVAASQQLQPIDLITGELPFLLAGLLGVGLLIRRSPAAAMARLGFVRPAWWQIVLGLAAAGAFFAFSSGVDLAAQHLTPDLARKVGSANDRLYGQLNTLPGIATIALAAGIGEETLFRGALQPRMGLVWTACVFAAVHTQYGLSLDALAVLILAIGLGLLRRYASTTTSLICHVTYNAVVGYQLAVSMLLPALAIELLLVALLVVAVLRRRRMPVGRATT